MLQLLQNHPETYSSLDSKTAYLHNEMIPLLEKKGLPFQINRLGSMLSLHFTDTPVVDFDTAAKGNNDFFKKYFHGMLKRGVYLPPSAFESYFLNDAICQNDLDGTLEAFSQTISSL
jgi:glutamate-1-semialdehyde 2,1-aminomutase